MTSPRVGWALILVGILALILVPFGLLGPQLEAWSLSVFETLSRRPALTAALVVGLLAADVLLPIPSSAVSTLSGALLGFTAGTAASMLGMTLGCIVGYGLGRTAGHGVARRLVGRSELARLERGAQRYGDGVLIAARAVPVLAEASTLLAGMSVMRPARFLALTGLSNLGISLIYGAVGAYAAELGSFLFAFAGAVLVPLLALMVWNAGHRRTRE